jgi:cyclic pyranopterin phosphate synthase
MPESGIDYVERKELLTYEEMVRIVRIVSGMGISKLRITGGEPFLRKDMMKFLRMVYKDQLMREVHITTNGTLTHNLVPSLKVLGIRSVNLSLDTVSKTRFHEITRRDQFDLVMQTFHALMKHGIPTKVNMVVMEGKNTDDLIPMANLAKMHPVGVRFIEEMPFNGSGKRSGEWEWNHLRILEKLKESFPDIVAMPFQSGSTSINYQIPGFKGTLGIIAAYSRTFCSTCNRLRITPKGQLKTCLYDHGVFNIKDMMRSQASDDQVKAAIVEALSHRSKDGFEAEKSRFHIPISESMSSIGG